MEGKKWDEWQNFSNENSFSPIVGLFGHAKCFFFRSIISLFLFLLKLQFHWNLGFDSLNLQLKDFLFNFIFIFSFSMRIISFECNYYFQNLKKNTKLLLLLLFGNHLCHFVFNRNCVKYNWPLTTIIKMLPKSRLISCVNCRKWTHFYVKHLSTVNVCVTLLLTCITYIKWLVCFGFFPFISFSSRIFIQRIKSDETL